jgi:hypothetical protein
MTISKTSIVVDHAEWNIGVITMVNVKGRLCAISTSG